MKYRAKIYIKYEHGVTHVTSGVYEHPVAADVCLTWFLKHIEQATGGHIEQFVDGIGWVMCEEDGE